MKKEWNPIIFEIITYAEEDIIRTSNNFDDGNNSSSKDDFEGEIDWG